MLLEMSKFKIYYPEDMESLIKNFSDTLNSKFERINSYFDVTYETLIIYITKKAELNNYILAKTRQYGDSIPDWLVRVYRQ